MKNIVLPTDFSESARKACEYAMTLYKGQEVRFILLNSYVMPNSTSEMLISLNDVLRQGSEEGLKADKEYLSRLFPAESVKIETRSIQGFLENVLHNIVQHEDIHLIIMGSTGASGFKKFFMGSNATQVLKNVDAPVLTIPYTTEVKLPSNVILALDESPLPGGKFINPLEDVIRAPHSKLLPVHIHTRPILAGELDDAPEITEALGIPVANVYSDNVLEGLHEYITEKNGDLLVMVHHPRSFIGNLFHRSSTRDMAMFTSIPLLVLQSERKGKTDQNQEK